MRVCGIGTLGQAAFVATLALWPLLFGCGVEVAAAKSSPPLATQQPGQRAPVWDRKATSGDARFSAENLHKLDRTIAQVRRDKNLPGVLVGVSVPGEGEYVSAQGSANLDTGTKPQSGDQFRIGSVTKTFVATAILQLVEEGKLRKSDTLSTWYPDFPNAGEITVDDLLRMRSPPLLERADAKALLRQPPAKRHERGHHRGHGGKADLFKPPDQGNGVPRDPTTTSSERYWPKVSGNDIYSAREHHPPTGVGGTFYPTDDELPGDLHGYGLDPKSGEFEDKTILNPAPSDGAGAMISDMSDLAVDLQGRPAPALGRNKRGWRYNAGKGIRVFGVWRGSRNWASFGVMAVRSLGSTDMWYLPEEDAAIVISVNRCDETYVNRSKLCTTTRSKEPLSRPSRTCDRPHPSG